MSLALWFQVNYNPFHGVLNPTTYPYNAREPVLSLCLFSYPRRFIVAHLSESYLSNHYPSFGLGSGWLLRPGQVATSTLLGFHFHKGVRYA